MQTASRLQRGAAHQQPRLQQLRAAPLVLHRGRPARSRPYCVASAQNVSVQGPWEVHKFGGTCVATADRIQRAVDLVLEQAAHTPVCAVVSALGNSTSFPVKVTDVLLRTIAKACSGNSDFAADLLYLRTTHLDTAMALLGASPEYDAYEKDLDKDLNDLQSMLLAVKIATSSTDAFDDFIVGHGELWSAKLFTARCKQLGGQTYFMDTRDFLVVSPSSDGGVELREEQSKQNITKWLQSPAAKPLIVATGFIARTEQGRATTLKRNGSDFSATIMGALLESRNITIWTDVDGVFSADPRKVPEAVCLGAMSYNEAWELAYFGASVLHPRTTVPAMKYNIPIQIRNFFNLASPGTCISKAINTALPVKGFATIDNVTLLSVEGTGLVGVPGIASTIFGVMRDSGVNVIMISQASSEQSICFAVKSADGPRAAQALRNRFSEALSSGSLSAIVTTDKCCVLAVVGQGMVNRKGVAATFLGALAKANVNVKAIAQGSSEYNITVLIAQADGERALRAVHSRFYLSSVPIAVAVVGPGQIGAALIAQLRSQAGALKQQFNIDLRVTAIADSKRMLLQEGGVDLATWDKQMGDKSSPADFSRLEQFLSASYIPNRVIVDCTASPAPVERYAEWMRQGIHIITPNKRLGSGPLATYKTVRQLQREGYIHFFYEATVGAGLPIMGTLKHLLETGDSIVRIEGIFSGTLSYIFNNWGAGVSFSSIVADAKAKGFTEPDPRDDLSGLDVARKVTILARECGVDLELGDVDVESLIPEPLRGDDVSAAQYMERLPQHDAAMAAKLDAALKAGKQLRYVGVVDIAAGKASVGLREYDSRHPFAQLDGTDNIISFTTQRYFKQPLVIRGPGAGAEVTAAGVFSDLLRLAAYLGAPS